MPALAVTFKMLEKQEINLILVTTTQGPSNKNFTVLFWLYKM